MMRWEHDLSMIMIHQLINCRTWQYLTMFPTSFTDGILHKHPGLNRREPGGKHPMVMNMWPFNLILRQSFMWLTSSSPSRPSDLLPCTLRSRLIGARPGTSPDTLLMTAPRASQMFLLVFLNLWMKWFVNQDTQIFFQVPREKWSTESCLQTSSSMLQASIPTAKKFKIFWRQPT